MMPHERRRHDEAARSAGAWDGKKAVRSVDRSILFAVAPLSLFAAATALAQAPPRNVNDCTLLRDSVQVKQCIESFQGAPPTPSLAPPPPPAVIRPSELPADPATPEPVPPPRGKPAPPPARPPFR